MKSKSFLSFLFLQVPYNVSPLYKTWTTISSRKGFIEMDDHTLTLSAFIAVLSRYDPVNCDTSEILELLYRCSVCYINMKTGRLSVLQ